MNKFGGKTLNFMVLVKIYPNNVLYLMLLVIRLPRKNFKNGGKNYKFDDVVILFRVREPIKFSVVLIVNDTIEEAGRSSRDVIFILNRNSDLNRVQPRAIYHVLINPFLDLPQSFPIPLTLKKLISRAQTVLGRKDNSNKMADRV